ncbi:MAG: ABC transporter substrate-binding protein [Hamadaea sp.]|uniref:ABC transporter substrate-binding protein n=1 Tax=Hamadaea sp. TaxID=2024425 RepID=UPI00179798D4|nr:ABC transporter substrate-binding protein [Hamadaea sp.]NUR71200.1 ABC transporter substrate-binding protein [Hamadaea sp.]NUT17731.1 ABC transporter substrate-binding protein [Hamadaea sp.]
MSEIGKPLVQRRTALRALGGLALGGLTAGAVSGCDTAGSASGPTGTVSIGLLIPQTDELKAIGSDIYDGFKLYTDLNRPFGTYDVTIVQAEERDKPEESKAAVDRLIKQGVSAIAGVALPETLLAIRDTVENAHIPLISAHQNPNSLQSVLFIWSSSYVGREPGVALGRYLQAIGASVVVVGNSELTSTDAVAGFHEGYAKAIPKDRVFKLGTQTTSSVVSSIEGLKPDAVFCALTGATGLAFIKVLRGAGVDADLYAPGDLTEGSALDTVIGSLGEKTAAGIYTAMNYSADLSNATNQLFASRFRATVRRTPSAYAVAGWDAAQALDKAIRACGEAQPSRDLINAKLGGLGQITSPRGTIAFNQTRTPLQKWYLRRVMKDGPKLANVTVRSLATLG